MTDAFERRPDPLITEHDTAKLLSISPDTLRRLSKRGEGPARRKVSPRRVGYKLSEVERYRDGEPLQSPAPERKAPRRRRSSHARARAR
jgi:predicted DNA-binding transcriptional regulator AlpA